MREPCPDCRVLTSNAPDPCPECALKRRQREQEEAQAAEEPKP